MAHPFLNCRLVGEGGFFYWKSQEICTRSTLVSIRQILHKKDIRMGMALQGNKKLLRAQVPEPPASRGSFLCGASGGACIQR